MGSPSLGDAGEKLIVPGTSEIHLSVMFPCATRANRCVPEGTTDARTVNVHTPRIGAATRTTSVLFPVSRDPLVCEKPSTSALPKKSEPSGARASRSMSLMRALDELAVPGTSDHTRTTRSSWPGSTKMLTFDVVWPGASETEG